MILSAYDDYIPINNSMAIQHFLMVITLRMTQAYTVYTHRTGRANVKTTASAFTNTC